MLFGQGKDFLGKRRDRAIAIILSYKERECDYYLPDNVSRELRKVVLDQINDICDLAMDLMNDDIDFNEEFLNKLDEILER